MKCALKVHTQGMCGDFFKKVYTISDGSSIAISKVAPESTY